MRSKAKSKYILYALANITLIGRIILFSDVFKKFPGYSDAIYLLFASLSIYTYLMTGLAYLLYVILELTYKFEQIHTMNRGRKQTRNCEKFLRFMLVAIPIIFLVSYIVQLIVYNNINSPNRVLALILYFIVGVIFIVLTCRLFTQMNKSELQETIHSVKRKVS